MKRSQFRQRITIVYQMEQVIIDDVGDVEVNEVIRTEVWAAVRDQYINDVKATAGTVYQNTIQFLLEPAFESIFRFKTAMHIEYKNEKYKVVRITYDPQRNKYITVYAEKFY